MKIVITDASTVTRGDISLDVFKNFGDLDIYQLTADSDVAQVIQNADIVLCNKTPMTKENLENATHLKYIGLFATGYNNVDIEFCKEKGITVCNAANYSTDAVAQHVFALLLFKFNRVIDYHHFVHDGMWKSCSTFSPFVFPLFELSHKTIGIVGYGNIGKAVAKIAKAMNMNVICYTRSMIGDQNAVAVDFDTLLSTSDIITVHCPLTDDTRHMFNQEAFHKMKDGVTFINTSRGGIVDENDLKNALNMGKIKFAGIDVLDKEPMAHNCPLAGARNCLITPHIAWAAVETRQRLVNIVAENLKSYLNGQPENVVC